jgi:hypothetical protein
MKRFLLIVENMPKNKLLNHVEMRLHWQEAQKNKNDGKRSK